MRRLVLHSSVHLLRPKNLLAVGKGDVNPLADRVWIFTLKRQNIGQKSLHARVGHRASPFCPRPSDRNIRCHFQHDVEQVGHCMYSARAGSRGTYVKGLTALLAGALLVLLASANVDAACVCRCIGGQSQSICSSSLDQPLGVLHVACRQRLDTPNRRRQ